MESNAYSKELEIACLTVQRATLLTKKLLAEVDKGTIDKSDDTPVTIADFAAQALIIAALHKAFPGDGFVGEEDSKTLRGNAELLDRTWELASSTRLDDDECNALLYSPSSREEMLDLIDLGAQGSCGPQGRVWVLDPVDGTATFMKNQQYAVCLSLVENGLQKVGVLGCPNLVIDSGKIHEESTDARGYGEQLFAVEGHGSWIRKMGRGNLLPAKPIEKQSPVSDPKDIRFVDCMAATSWNIPLHSRVATQVEAPWPPATDLWAAQLRYVAFAVGGVNAMVKIPRKPDHRSKIWDHAGGMLIATELGHMVTDLAGKPIECDKGRTLAGAVGMIVAHASIHGQVVEATKKVLKENGQDCLMV